MGTGEKIKQIRKLAGMSQEELAEKLGISRQTVSKWKNEVSSPDLESALCLCELFQISLDDFAGRDSRTEKEAKLSLQDIVKINKRSQRMTIILMSGLFFLMAGILAVLLIGAFDTMLASVLYMLYRYIAVGEYAYLPVDYWRLVAPAIVLIVIGAILCGGYIREKWKEKRRNP